MGYLVLALDFLTVGLGLISAYLWWRASRWTVPSLPGDRQHGIGMGPQHDWLKMVEEALSESATRNRWAALATGGAVLTATLSTMLKPLAS